MTVRVLLEEEEEEEFRGVKMAKIKVLHENEEKMTFILDGEDPSFAAELRRIMGSEIPVMAIRYVDFVENDSGLFDEVLAHRVGLIPWTWDKEAYNIPEDDSDTSNEVQFALDKEGPCVVRASDLKSTDESVKPVDDNVIVVELLEGQKLKFEATATLGLGKEHAKYQSAVVGYQYYPEKITVKPKGDAEELVKNLPGDIVEKDGDNVVITDPLKHDPNLMKLSRLSHDIEGDENRIVFYVESVCALSAREIVESSIDILNQKAEELKDKVSDL